MMFVTYQYPTFLDQYVWILLASDVNSSILYMFKSEDFRVDQDVRCQLNVCACVYTSI